MNKKGELLTLFLFITGMIFTVSCSTSGSLSSLEDAVFEQIKKEALQHERMIEKEMFIHEPVIFDFNESKLSPEAQSLLARKVLWLKENLNINIIIEGYCDSLGNESYNMLLGKKRGLAVKKFLIDMNIDESRMSIISFGKSKPINSGKSEEDLVKNRRVKFCLVNQSC